MARNRTRAFEQLENRRLLAADFAAADFNGDRILDSQDVDALILAIRSADTRQSFDLNADGLLSSADFDYLIEDVLGTRPGDTDLDGDVDFGDFLSLSSHFGLQGGWAVGESDLSPDIAFGDFLELSSHFGFQKSTVSYTNHSVDGNRFVGGWSEVPSSAPLDIDLPFVPDWVLGASLGEGQLWVAVSRSGQVHALEITGRDVKAIDLEHQGLVAGMPPALESDGAGFRIITRPEDASAVTHPIRFGRDMKRLAYIREDGDVVVVDESGQVSSARVNAMLDSRILADGAGRLLLLTDPTAELRHGVLGDRIEANSFTVIDTNVEPWEISKVDIPDGKVIEGISPIWTDVDGDGVLEIIVTLSSTANGGQHVVYEEDGSVALQEPGIGRGSRWRHQIAVAPFGPNGEMEFVDVLTPHIGGVVEFRSLDTMLPVVGRVTGNTSHTIRSRNLDLAVAGDFDSDGVVELLLPTQQRDRLSGVSRLADGAALEWQVPVGGILSTNVGVLKSMTGSLTVGVGRSDGTLRVFL